MNTALHHAPADDAGIVKNAKVLRGVLVGGAKSSSETLNGGAAGVQNLDKANPRWNSDDAQPCGDRLDCFIGKRLAIRRAPALLVRCLLCDVLGHGALLNKATSRQSGPPFFLNSVEEVSSSRRLRVTVRVRQLSEKWQPKAPRPLEGAEVTAASRSEAFRPRSGAESCLRCALSSAQPEPGSGVDDVGIARADPVLVEPPQVFHLAFDL